MKYWIVAITFFLTGLSCSGQNKILDSLRKIVLRHDGDTTAVNAAVELCYEFRFVNQDSALHYGRLAIAAATKLNYQKGLAQALSDAGVIAYDKSDLKSASESWGSSLAIRERMHDTLKMAGLHLKIGSLLFRQGHYERSLEHQLTALVLYESMHADAGASYALNNVAAVYEHQAQLDKALEYYLLSYKKKEAMQNDVQMGITQVNIGNIYFRKHEYEKAKEELDQCIHRLEKSPANRDMLAIAFNNLSDVYRMTGYYDSALAMTDKSLQLRLAIRDYQGIVSSLNNMGSILVRQKKYDEAQRVLMRALDSARVRNLTPETERIYFSFYELNEAEGKPAEALKFYKMYADVKDSLLNEASQRSINELQVEYDTELKERELSRQQIALAESGLALQKSNNRVILFSAAAILIFLIAVAGYQYQRSRIRKQRAQARHELELASVRAQNELQQDRLRISRELHDNIGSRLLFITATSENLADASKTEESEKIEKISLFARDTLHELRRAVWLINRDAVSLDELQSKMQEYFGFLIKRGLGIHVSASGDTTRPIRSQKAAAIFRIVQEAVTNAIRHAAPHRIDVLMQANENAIDTLIRDDGNGFDSEKSYAGNGLHNMRTHAAAAEGAVAISSAIGEGTLVSVKIRFA